MWSVTTRLTLNKLGQMRNGAVFAAGSGAGPGTQPHRRSNERPLTHQVSPLHITSDILDRLCASHIFVLILSLPCFPLV
jgi:hypothetical protein